MFLNISARLWKPSFFCTDIYHITILIDIVAGTGVRIMYRRIKIKKEREQRVLWISRIKFSTVAGSGTLLVFCIRIFITL